MDPDATVAEILALKEKGPLSIEERDQLAELQQSLRVWLAMGGYKPEGWRQAL